MRDNPTSFLHVSRPEIDLPLGTDEHDDAVYAMGARNLTALIAQGSLVQDPEPHLYVYEQVMGEHRQVGVVGCASVAEYLSDRIKKHERIRTNQRGSKTGGIVTQEAAIHISNVQVLDGDGKPTRIGYKIDENGNKVRIARTTGKEL